MRKSTWTDERLTRLFERYNKRFWSGKLPTYRVVVTTSRTGGLCDRRKRQILMNVESFRSDSEIRRMLLHEMAHIIALGHGKLFQRELERLIRAGAMTLHTELKAYRDPLRITSRVIIAEFEDAASEVSWRQALRKIGWENGLIDATGRLTSKWAEGFIEKAKKIFHRARRRDLRLRKMIVSARAHRMNLNRKEE